MGWKNVKEHYQIGHIVQVADKGICIGSGYVHDLAVIDPATGVITENRTFNGFLREKYPALLEATPAELLNLINAPDSFERSLTVYTYEGGEILEKQCEEYGYPNVTHDGCQIYENTFFQEKSAAIAKAIENAGYAIENANDNIERLEEKLKDARGWLAERKSNLEKLTALQQCDA